MAKRVATRREDILATTLDQMVRRGMHEIRVHDVAEAMGISSALIHYHFESKDALLVAAYQKYADADFQHVQEVSTRQADAMQRLNWVLYECGPTGEASAWLLWIDAWAVALQVPAMRAILKRMDERWRHTIATIIEEGVAQRLFTCGDPSAAAARLIAVLEGFTLMHLVHHSMTLNDLRNQVAWMAGAETGVDPEFLGYREAGDSYSGSFVR